MYNYGSEPYNRKFFVTVKNFLNYRKFQKPISTAIFSLISLKVKIKKGKAIDVTGHGDP
jgi:hypothetical protein